jgi:hypothetical protein
MTDTDLSIETLAQQVAEYLRSHRRTVELRNEAGQLVVPGQQATGRLVVNPGDEIQSVWGNTTYDQTMQVYASVTDRDSQWTAPHDGALAYTIDTQSAWLRRAGAWVLIVPPRYASIVSRTTAMNTSATAGTWTMVVCNSVVADPGNLYSTTNGVYTCPVSGFYQINAHVGFAGGSSGQYFNVGVYRNGAVAGQTIGHSSSATVIYPNISLLLSCLAGDTLALWVACGLASNALRVGAIDTGLSIAYLGQ